MNLRLYETRRGLMFHLENDNCIGLALAKYGEWAEHELSLMKKFIHPGDVVLDVGANIGTHSLAFQKWVGAEGLVLAFEPQKKIFQILCANLGINNCPSTFAINALISKENKIHFFTEKSIDEKTNFGSVSFSNTDSQHISTSTKKLQFPLAAIQLDTLNLDRCDFIKIDVGGMELEVLQSCQELIKIHYPIIFFEQVTSRNFFEIVSFFKDHNYRLYWQVTYPFNRANFKGGTENIFGSATETYILALPEQVDLEKFPELVDKEIRGDVYDPPSIADAELGCYISNGNAPFTTNCNSISQLEMPDQYSDNRLNSTIIEMNTLTESYNTLVEDRKKTEVIIEHQGKEIQDLKSAFDNLLEDRQKAQQIMEYQLQKIQELTISNIEITDDWTDADSISHRNRLAKQYLKGSGIEIGALHKPTKVSLSTKVKYVDYKTTEENLAQYPELQNENIVETDIVDDAFVLSKLDAESQDFFIANHVLEHSPNPIGTLKTWLSKVRTDGCLLFSVPIADRCFDKGRPVTPLEHMIEDYILFSESRVDEIINTTRAHLKEFIEISDLNIRKQAGLPPAKSEEQKEFLELIMLNLMQEMYSNPKYEQMIEAHVKCLNSKYDVHYHTFSPTSFLNFCKYFTQETKCVIKEITKSGGGEVIVVLKKIHQCSLL